MKIKITVKYVNDFIKKYREELSDKTENQLADSLTYNHRYEDRLMELVIDHWTDKELELFKDHVKPSLAEDGAINPVLQAISVTTRMRKNPKTVKIPSLEKFPHMFYNWLRKCSVDGRVQVTNSEGHILQYVIDNASYTPRHGEYEAYCSVKASYIRGWKEESYSWTFSQRDLKGKSLNEVVESRGMLPVSKEDIERDEELNQLFMKFCEKDGIQYTCGGYAHSISSRYGISSKYRPITDGIKHKLVSDDGSIENRVDHMKMKKYPNWYADSSDTEKEPLSTPIHQFARLYDLNKHSETECHISELVLYKYKPELIKKLIIPDDHKSLLETLATGTDKLAQDVVENKTGGIIFLLSGAAGLGKCHGKGTKILMSDMSVKNVEDVEVGDYLMGDDSRPRKVLSLASGKERLFKIKPNKHGDDFVINESHILTLKNSGERYSNELVDVEFKEYLSWSDWKKKNHKLVRANIKGDDSKNPDIDPYFLGLWLGDGDWRSPNIWVNVVRDREIAGYLEDYAEAQGLRLRYKDPGNSGDDCISFQITCQEGKNVNHIKRQLESLTNGQDKVLNQDILRCGDDFKRNLLAGYIDADGYKADNGVYEVVSKREELTKQIALIARSLGYAVTERIKEVKWSGNADNGQNISRSYHRIFISGAYDLPCMLPRKISGPRPEMFKSRQVTGFTYEDLGEGDYYGFSIDGNRRYLLRDTTITHNTLSAEVFSEYLKKPLYIVQASQLGTSIKGLEDNLKQVLSRTKRWDALLLIDEADVYVRRRGTDIQQNAIVGVFLRILEYFSGVMMLTTNLPEEVDEAIISRMTAHVHFEHPNSDQRVLLWEQNLKAYDLKYDISKVKEVSDKLLISGRLIKNMTKLIKFIIDMENDHKEFGLDVVKYAMNFSPANKGELKWLDEDGKAESA